MAGNGFLNTTFRVYVPPLHETALGTEDFRKYIKSLPSHKQYNKDETDKSDHKSASSEEAAKSDNSGPFIDAMLSDQALPNNKMFTENSDVAFRSSGEALVDLFHELEDVILIKRLNVTLEDAWKDDPLGTLKIIWNARSIHLGKSSRTTFYRAVGWLWQNHPHTLLLNLPWLVRPVIQKKKPKEKPQESSTIEKKDDVDKIDAVMVDADEDDDFELIDANVPSDDRPSKKAKIEEDASLSAFDIRYGLAHGYWKDLLNILALAANDELKVNGVPRKVLNIEIPSKTKTRRDRKKGAKAHKRDWTPGRKKERLAERYIAINTKLEDDALYKALHIAVARLFAEQLKVDKARLESGSKAELKRISLAAKWAPSNKGMHDEHTLIASTIAELLHPFDSLSLKGVDQADRSLFLKHARVAYQSATLSPLRKHLDIVERPITENKFEDIKFDRIPSLAMKQYMDLFIQKDSERFEQYINGVAEGKVRISGATLLPSTLVADARTGGRSAQTYKAGAKGMVERKRAELERDIRSKAADGQWRALVQRIRDSGTMESAIAVCDVSGSMSHPQFKDGTCPMDSAIGLSLLLAEVCEPPFGGVFITFDASPQILKAGGKTDKRDFHKKVKYIANSPWGGNTNFAAVFEKLILPRALAHKVKKEDMVKRVFVFSDMQFDGADSGASSKDRWRTSYERIKIKFDNAGYDMPELVFWNLAGGRASYGSGSKGFTTAPKPVEAREKGTALVSGYSQAMLKVFLDGGSFADAEDEDDMVEIGEDGQEIKKEKKGSMDPLSVVKKAIGHEAYRMLEVVD